MKFPSSQDTRLSRSLTLQTDSTHNKVRKLDPWKPKVLCRCPIKRKAHLTGMLCPARVLSRAAACILPVPWMLSEEKERWGPDVSCSSRWQDSLTSEICKAHVNVGRTWPSTDMARARKGTRRLQVPKRKWLQRTQHTVGLLWSGLQVVIGVIGKSQAWPWRREVPVQESYSWAQTRKWSEEMNHHSPNHQRLHLHGK